MKAYESKETNERIYDPNLEEFKKHQELMKKELMNEGLELEYTPEGIIS